MIPKSQHPIPSPFQIFRPPFISGFLYSVLPAVQFNNEKPVMATKIGDPGTEGFLAAELEAEKPFGAEVTPENGFRLCHGRPQRSSEIGVGSLFHSAPSPSPPPAGGIGKTPTPPPNRPGFFWFWGVPSPARRERGGRGDPSPSSKRASAKSLSWRLLWRPESRL